MNRNKPPVMRGFRLRPSQVGGGAAPEGVKDPIVTMENGYLWIGGDSGPCLVYLSGIATLKKLATLIRRFAQ